MGFFMNHNYVSSDSEINGFYQSSNLLDIKDYLKFYNVKTDNYNFKEISFKNNSISSFLDEQSISEFVFFASIFSLYLSRIDSTKGCLLKTFIHDEDNNSFEKKLSMPST